MISGVLTRAALPRNVKAEVRRARQLSGRRPSVSVVVPCYNYGRYLPDCVQSVLDQQEVDVDVIIIDDASPDGSAETVKRLTEQDSRVQAIYHEANRGHIATYNEGFAQVRGDYAMLLSADDRLTPGALARATALMEQFPTVGLAYGVALDFTDTQVPPARTAAKNWIIWSGREWLALRCRTGHNVLRSPEAVVRTSALREIGDYRSDLPHTADFELWMRLATMSDIGFITGADQAYYRIHENNMHHSKFDLVDDLAGRLKAFNTVFDERQSFVPGADELRDTAHRRMALEALSHAISAHTRGVADKQQVEKYMEFAVASWPGVKGLGEWDSLSILQETQGKQQRQGLGPMLRERARNLGYSLNWWRWRWSGVY